jgi:tRNA-splicing ligase RtcB
MMIIDGVPVWGELQQDALTQIKNCQKDAVKVALMADHHVGYSVPIGGVVAYDGKVSPSGVGYDIACGNKEALRASIKPIMDDVARTISFGVGRRNAETVDHVLFDADEWSIVPHLKEMAREQLGTVGSGNHYVDLFTDEQDRVWIGVHFGSRGLGHKIATKFIEAAGGKDGMFVDPVTLDVNSYVGMDYVKAMGLAGEYAYAGRDWVCYRVAKILGAVVLDEVHNHHNFAWEEGGLWVVRKGATPAFPGQRGFVGGTMGEASVILEGTAAADPLSMYSTVHGAGRIMGRREAAGKWKKGVQVSPGKVTPDMMKTATQHIELRGGGLDESPHVYKRLPEVLGAHGDSIRILHTLTPVGVAMAGANEYDPYKD